MYPPRSAKYKKEKKQKQQRQSKFWMIINLTLIVAVCLVGLYIYYSSNKSMSADANEAAASAGQGTGAANNGAPTDNGNEEGAGTPSGNEESGAQPAASADDHSASPEASGNAGHPSQSDDSGRPAGTGDKAVNAPASQDPGTALPADPAFVESPDDLILHFGGDTLFSGKVEEKLEKDGYDSPFQYVSSLFMKDDLTVLNLETPVTKGGVGAEDKQFVFKSPPKALTAMAAAGVDAVNLANNHTLDQGVEGLLDTLDYLKTENIAAVGAGADADQAYAPQYFERKGIKIALLGFSRVLPKTEWAAGAGKPGIASVYDPSRAYAAIKAARSKADVVIVVTHWGKERVQQREASQTTLAHGYIDAGADLVIGGHPHVLQGMEQYKGKWIAYSTGNFIFTRSSNPKTWETAVFEARVNKAGECKLKLIPYTAELGQPVPMNAVDGAKLLQELQALSPGVTIDQAGHVSSK